jgi:hypothetical protein
MEILKPWQHEGSEENPFSDGSSGRWLTATTPDNRFARKRKQQARTHKERHL